jgi:broad specificity phosphatase PhoE
MKVVSLIASHNSRIQCLLDRINPITTKTRFQNCAVLRLSINKSDVDLSLVYSGELSESEKTGISAQKPYYTTDDKLGQPGYVGYIFNKINVNEAAEKLNLTMNDLANNDFVFYIVRHGQGKHNEKVNLKFAKVSATFGLEKDTSVTVEGKQQAYNSGAALSEILSKNGETIQNWFSSDLVRTRETIVEIIKGLNLNEKPFAIVVLPCASEISTSGSGSGDCDLVASSSSLFSKMAQENYPNCKLSDIRNPTDRQGCSNIDGIPISWDLYLKFYGNQIRGVYGSITSKMTSIAKEQCRNTNMISMAVFFINGGSDLSEYIKNRKDVDQSLSRVSTSSFSSVDSDAETPRVYKGMAAGKKSKRRKSKKTKKTKKSKKRRKTRKN